MARPAIGSELSVRYTWRLENNQALRRPVRQMTITVCELFRPDSETDEVIRLSLLDKCVYKARGHARSAISDAAGVRMVSPRTLPGLTA